MAPKCGNSPGPQKDLKFFHQIFLSNICLVYFPPHLLCFKFRMTVGYIADYVVECCYPLDSELMCYKPRVKLVFPNYACTFLGGSV